MTAEILGSDTFAEPAELDAADATDAAATAQRMGVDLDAVRAAFGDQAAELAAFVGRLVTNGSAPPTPPAAFAEALEAHLVDRFETRPVPAAAFSTPRRTRQSTPFLVLGSLAACLALVAVLSGANPFRSRGTDVSTVAAATSSATSTATRATPQAGPATRPTQDLVSRARAADGRSAVTLAAPRRAPGPDATAAPVPGLWATAGPPLRDIGAIRAPDAATVFAAQVDRTVVDRPVPAPLAREAWVDYRGSFGSRGGMGMAPVAAQASRTAAARNSEPVAMMTSSEPANARA
jgi:hypothetical protein